MPTTGWIRRLASDSLAARSVSSRCARCRGLRVWKATMRRHPNIENCARSCSGVCRRPLEVVLLGQRVRVLSGFLVEHLISPHGGALVQLMAGDERIDELKTESVAWPSWDLTPRQICDLELLLNGGFSPLGGFMARADYESVVRDMRLADGTLWPIPITLDVTEELAGRLRSGDWLSLRDPEGVMLAALQVSDVWQPDRGTEAEAVFGSTNPSHPGVDYLLKQSQRHYVAGRLEGVHAPMHYDYRDLRHTPEQLRAQFSIFGWRRVVAFQTRNPLHRAHLELTIRAAKESEASLLIHPVVGMTKPGNVDHYTRVRCYQSIMPSYPHGTATPSLLPLAMRMGAPRSAL